MAKSTSPKRAQGQQPVSARSGKAGATSSARSGKVGATSSARSSGATTSGESTHTSKLREIRSRNGTPPPLSRGQQRRRDAQRAKQPWWRGPMPTILTVLVVVVVVVGFWWAANRPANTSGDTLIGKTAPVSLVSKVTDISPTVISTVGNGGLPVPLKTISNTPALTDNGKPELLYIGGEFCPYCAAERWSLVNALSRFGTFSNLKYMKSAATDGNYATFTFYGSTYTSKYISFVPRENEDRSQNPLQSLNTQQQSLFDSIGGDGYPFLDLNGKYASGAQNAYSGGYDPAVLGSSSWTQIANDLSNPSSNVTKGIVGNANYLTAAICKVTNNQPASACSSSTIQTIEKQLP